MTQIQYLYIQNKTYIYTYIKKHQLYNISNPYTKNKKNIKYFFIT